MATLEEHFLHFRRTGDPELLAAVYDATAPRLLRTALYLVGSTAEAEDVLQAAFVAAIERRDAWDGARPLLPWLVGIVANQARLLRARQRRAPDPARLPAERHEDPAAAASALEFTEAVDAATDRLPEIYRSVLVLHLRHGLQPADIAHALGRPPGTVRAQLLRGLEQLRQLLPAGLASGVAVVVAGRGLAAVRAAVVQRAAEASTPVAVGGLAATLLALTAMNKTLLSVGAAAVATLFLWAPWSAPVDAPIDAGAPALAASPALAGAPEGGGRGGGAIVAGATVLVGNGRTTVASVGDAGERSTVRGRAVWAEDGTAAAGITVWCREVLASARDRELAVTDAAGHFEFVGRADARYALGGDRGGEAAWPDAAGSLAEVTLVVPAGLLVRGRVVDGSGEVVPGADLWLSEWNYPTVGAVCARTGADGRFELRSVGTHRYLGARKDGHAPSPLVYLEPQSAPLERDFVVGAYGDATVAGKVFDAAGLPIAGARVEVGPPAPAAATMRSGAVELRSAPQAGRCDGEGRFELRGLLPGGLIVNVGAPGYGAFATACDVGPGGRHELAVVLPAAAQLVGRVARADGGPLVGAMVAVGSVTDFAHVRTFADRDGAFVLRDITPGDAELAVYVDSKVVLARHIVLLAGEVRTWNPVVGEQGRIEGVVLGAGGEPMAGLRVVASRDEAVVDDRHTDGAGRFAFDGLAQGSYRVDVVLDLRGQLVEELGCMMLARRDHIVPDGPVVRIEVDADAMPSCALRGRIATARGEVPAARVWVGSMSGNGVAVLAVDPATCAFAVERLVPGPYWLTVRAPGHPELVLGRRELAAGQDLDLGALELPVGAAARGELDLPSTLVGAPRLEVYSAGNVLVGEVPVDGPTFRTELLAAGDYRLLVRGQGLATTAIAFAMPAAASTPLRVRVPAGVRREIVATVPADAAPPRWVGLSLMQAGEPLGGSMLVRCDDGSFRGEVWVGAADCEVFLCCDEARLQGHATVAAAGREPVVVTLHVRR